MRPDEILYFNRKNYTRIILIKYIRPTRIGSPDFQSDFPALTSHEWLTRSTNTFNCSPIQRWHPTLTLHGWHNDVLVTFTSLNNLLALTFHEWLTQWRTRHVHQYDVFENKTIIRLLNFTSAPYCRLTPRASTFNRQHVRPPSNLQPLLHTSTYITPLKKI
jgi:hypothetical protein